MTRSNLNEPYVSVNLASEQDMDRSLVGPVFGDGSMKRVLKHSLRSIAVDSVVIAASAAFLVSRSRSSSGHHSDQLAPPHHDEDFAETSGHDVRGEILVLASDACAILLQVDQWLAPDDREELMSFVSDVRDDFVLPDRAGTLRNQMWEVDDEDLRWILVVLDRTVQFALWPNDRYRFDLARDLLRALLSN